jgi:hypothetical protein
VAVTQDGGGQAPVAETFLLQGLLVYSTCGYAWCGHPRYPKKRDAKDNATDEAKSRAAERPSGSYRHPHQLIALTGLGSGVATCALLTLQSEEGQLATAGVLGAFFSYRRYLATVARYWSKFGPGEYKTAPRLVLVTRRTSSLTIWASTSSSRLRWPDEELRGG